MIPESTLYIVSTPIGNLKDITLRALEILEKVDYIISEDARITGRLLNHYKIKNKQILYRDENKNKAIPKILDLLKAGHTLALTSDSGTPLISDPGFKLVSKTLKDGYKVITIPGPTASTAALSISGLPTDKYAFVGFLPRKKSERKKIMVEYGNLDCTLIIYESRYRVLKLMNEISANLGNRVVAVIKEMTKVHETTFLGNVNKVEKLLSESNLKGEFVVLIAKKEFDLNK